MIRHRSKLRARQSGFTLLEAIVALTIIGIALIPVMAFLAESSRQLTVAADSNRRAMTQQTVFAFVEALNPLLRPDGEEQLSAHIKVRWQSTMLVDSNNDTRLGGRLGGFDIGFYRVDVTVLEDDREWFDFQARKLGYRSKSQGMFGGTPPP